MNQVNRVNQVNQENQRLAGTWGAKALPQRSLLAFEGPPEPEVASCGLVAGTRRRLLQVAGCRELAGASPPSTSPGLYVDQREAPKIVI